MLYYGTNNKVIYWTNPVKWEFKKINGESPNSDEFPQIIERLSEVLKVAKQEGYLDIYHPVQVEDKGVIITVKMDYEFISFVW